MTLQRITAALEIQPSQNSRLDIPNSPPTPYLEKYPLSSIQCPNTFAEHNYFTKSNFHFQAAHGSLRIHVVIPVQSTERFVSELMGELIDLAEIFGTQNIFVSFGINASRDDAGYRRVQEASTKLKGAEISHHIGIVSNVTQWQYKTVLGYDAPDFRLTIVVGGFTCAAHLSRLVFSTVLNNADLACGLDMSLSAGSMAPPRNLAHHIIPLAGADLFDTGLHQMDCCHGLVAAFSSRIFGLAKLEHAMKERNAKCPTEHPSIAFCNSLHTRSSHGAKIMLDTSVISSQDFDGHRVPLTSANLERSDYQVQHIEWRATGPKPAQECI